jgi:hypothetical protein
MPKKEYRKAAPPTTLVIIEWVDASFQGDTIALTELAPLIALQTAGFLIMEDVESITVAHEYCDKDQTCRHVTHIPKVCVRKIKRIKM